MAELLVQFVEQNPDFYTKSDPTQDIKSEVYKQAARHLVRDAPNDIMEKKRPFQTDEYQKYRKANRRHITGEPLWEFEKMLVKAHAKTPFAFEDLPKRLQENLEFNKYTLRDSKVDIDTWISEVLVSASMLDANAITVDIPRIPGLPFVPPSLPEGETGLAPESELPVSTKIFYYSQWRVLKDPDILVLTIKDGFALRVGDEIKMLDYHFLADGEDWYIHLPRVVEQDGTIKYSLIFWYNHRYGSLPYVAVPGVNAYSIKEFYYQESFCKPYYCFADEFESRFQDDQVVQSRYAHPREIVDPSKCKLCKGTGIRGVEDPINKANIRKITCTSCEGTGQIVVNSVQGRFLRDKSALEKTSKEPIAFVSPDVGILSHTTPNAFFFFEEARKMLGLQAFTNTTESGEAKKVRDQNKVEKLLSFAIGLVRWKQAHLNIRKSLLRGISEEDQIILAKPLSIAVKSEDSIKEEIMNSLPVDRFDTILKYIQEKYSTDTTKQRVHTLALLYAPFLGLDKDEIAVRIEPNGPYKMIEYLKADKAVFIFDQLVKSPNFSDPTKIGQIFKEADDILKSLITIPDVTIN